MDGIDPRLRGPEQPSQSHIQSFSNAPPSHYSLTPIRLPPPSPQQSHHQLQPQQARQHEHHAPGLPFWQQDTVPTGNIYQHQSQNAPPANSFTQGNNASIVHVQSHRQAPADSKRPRACEACRGLKVRCEFDAEASDCKRCIKAGRQCQVTQPSRKRQKKTDTKVAELERRIEALNAAIQGRGDLPLAGKSEGDGYGENGTPRTGVRESNSTPARVATMAPAETKERSHPLSGESYGTFPEQKSLYPPNSASPAHKRRLLNYSDEGGTYPNQSENESTVSIRQQPDFGEYASQATTGARKSANIDPLLTGGAALSKGTEYAPLAETQVECEQILNHYFPDPTVATGAFLHYVRNMSGLTPIVAFSPIVDPGSVREKNPLLFLTIITITSDTNIQPELTFELTKVLASHILVEAHKSLELVQALQLLALYYWPNHGREPIYNTYIEIARTMAFDLGISKPSPHGAHFSHWAFHNTRLSSTEFLEGARACLGNFLIAKNAIRRSHHQPVNPECLNVDASLQLLESSSERIASDQILCQWTRGERSACRYTLRSGKGEGTGTLLEAEGEIAEGKDLIAVPNGPNALTMTYHGINLEVYKHITSIQSAIGESLANQRWVSSIHGILECFLKFMPDEVATLPAFHVFRVGHVIFTLVQMLHDKKFSREELKIQLYLDGVMSNLRASVKQRTGLYIYWLLVVLKALSLWFEKQTATASGLQLLSDVATENGVEDPPNDALNAFKLVVADTEFTFFNSDVFHKLVGNAANQFISPLDYSWPTSNGCFSLVAIAQSLGYRSFGPVITWSTLFAGSRKHPADHRVNKRVLVAGLQHALRAQAYDCCACYLVNFSSKTGSEPEIRHHELVNRLSSMPVRTQRRTGSSSQASSRFSAWFHGHSVMSGEHSRMFVGPPKTWRTQDRFANRPGRRSPSSTRSIIDPTSSPNVGSESPRSGVFVRSQLQPLSPIPGTRYESEEVVGVQCRTKTRTRLALSRPRMKPRHNNDRRKCFPWIKASPVRRRAMWTLISGILLCVAVTTCMVLKTESFENKKTLVRLPSTCTDLALRISKTVTKPAFHAVSLVLIVLLSIIFCHDLIRLCMLAAAPKSRQDYRDAFLMQRQTAATSIARPPREPIRITFTRDEELGLHDEHHPVVEEDESIALAPPPPAYGLWRGSVRVDPDLVHWQRVEQSSDGFEEPPQRALLSTFTRPPSYHSAAHRTVTRDA
ncbi:MAG: hypothetical protein Q9191_003026 [Dirinaria sp. TL-2023a]